MARTTYTELNGEITPEVMDTMGNVTTPRNTIQARALADGVDIYSGILSTAGDQTTFTPPHPLRSCTTYQWYWDDLRGFGGLPIRAPREGETYGVEVAPERISDAYATAMIGRTTPTGVMMYNFGSRNATQDTFTIDTSNVGNSGEYYCVISVGLEASQCIRVESARNRVSIVECLEVNGAATPSDPRVRRRYTFPAEGGMVDIRAVHPHYESIVFDSEASWLTQSGDAILQNPLPNVHDNTYVVAASANILARQAYVNLNIGSFQCSYAFTQTYERSTRLPASDPGEGDRVSSFGPVIGIVSDSGPTQAGSTTVLTAESRYFNNSETSFTANDIGTITWSVDTNVGSITASEAVIDNVKVGTAVFTPVDNTFTGTIEVTASVDGVSHSRTITYVTATTATDPDGNVLSPATVIRGEASGDVFCSSLDGTTTLPTLTGTFEVLYSDALIQFDVDHSNYFDPSASSTVGASRTLQYNILGPVMLDGTISATSTSGRVTSEQFTLTPGTYTWSISMTNCSTPFAGDGGAGRMRTFPTVYS